MDVDRRRSILLLGKSTFQNVALSDYLNSATRRQCRIVERIPPTVNQGQHLLLVDAADELPLDLLRRLELAGPLAESAHVGLLNVRPTGCSAEIIGFPFLKAIFPMETEATQLARGIEAVLRGEVWLPRTLMASYIEQIRRHAHRPASLHSALTEKEKQILALLSAGHPNAAIAAQLSVSVHTIKTHIYNIFRKIQVRNRTQATNWANRNLDATGEWGRLEASQGRLNLVNGKTVN